MYSTMDLSARRSAQMGKVMSIKAGDIVNVAANAFYYNGKPVPAWVIGDKWIVKKVNGDRAVIDKNTSGTASINSPVNTCFLTVLPEGKAEQTKHSVSAPPSASAPSVPTQISDKGVELIARYEGCRLEAYKCPAGIWTIGYGHTAGVRQGDCLASKEEAMALLAKDLVKYADKVNSCVQSGKITFVPNQNQFDALTSFCYNCGAGALQKLVNDRTAAQVADAMLLYNKGGGRVLQGLVKRRQEERDLFLSC